MPDLIPVRDFVANRESAGGHKLSPNGKHLAWFGTQGVSSVIWVKTLATGGVRAFQIRARRINWSADSRFLAITADQSGDENTRIYRADLEANNNTLTDLTPFAGSLNYIHRVVDEISDIVIGSNRRDKKVFDLYRLQMTDGALTPLATNPGNVGGWGIDRLGQLRGRVLLLPEASQLQVPDAASTGSAGNQTSWKTTAQWSRFDSVQLVEFLDNGRQALALSNRGRDKMALVRVELANGAESLLHETPDVDIDQVLLAKKTQALRLVYSMPDYPRQEVFDTQLKAQLDAITKGQRLETHVSSQTDDEQALTVVASSDRGSKTYLVAPGQPAPQLLGESSTSLLEAKLVATQPIRYISRDGLTLHGYLTLPAGTAPRGLPMVLLVHGGPWARDRWYAGGTSRSLQQFFANRGYAVLQVNYRGSSGYGKTFMEKAIGESAGKMHDDLIDGVNWAVSTGLADPKKVAIYGASYGGYAALVGATFTPDVFACAVSVVGVADFSRQIANAPPYWELGNLWWHRYVGDPKDPAQRQVMDAKSPLFKAAHVKIPMLIMHGVNDVRVKREQSELMVAALQKAGKEVEYLQFHGDGHGNQKWSNNLAMYRKTEDFLARCLGGRSGGFDYYQLASWAF